MSAGVTARPALAAGGPPDGYVLAGGRQPPGHHRRGPLPGPADRCHACPARRGSATPSAGAPRATASTTGPGWPSDGAWLAIDPGNSSGSAVSGEQQAAVSAGLATARELDIYLY